eukprot:2822109-Alexandrium_andersonii.AAC.1
MDADLEPGAPASSGAGCNPGSSSLADAPSGASNRSRKKPATAAARKQSLESQVSKALKDNFPTWSAIDIDGVKLGQPPMSLRERLTADKKKVQDTPGCIVFGSTYYRQLRELYTSTSQPEKQLK